MPEADDLATLVRGTPGWDRVAAATLAELVERAELRRTPAKRPLFRRGDPDGGLCVVRSGQLKLSLISSEGREQLLSLCEPGRVVVEGLVLNPGATAAVSAFARKDSECWRWSTEAVLEVAERSPVLMRALLTSSTARIGRLVDLLYDVTLRSVEQRLASLLLSMARRLHAEHDRPFAIPRDLDVATVATLLGTVREEVTRAQRKLAERGLITLDRKQVTVPDLGALEELL